MINELVNYFNDKKILILGFGREGKSTYKFIRKYNKNVFIAISDLNNDIKNDELLVNDNNIKLVLGDAYLDEIYNGYNCILKSPGIVLKDYDLSSIKDYITSEMELFLTYFKGFTIGVTGTKGKSTTSSLIYEVVKNMRDNVFFLGNIGIPVFDKIEEMNDESLVVLEMGVHQLQYMTKSPNIAIFLNVYEEHLDHYKDYNDYIDSKCNIFRHQTKDDYFIYNRDSNIIVERNNKYKTESIKYTVGENPVYNNNSINIVDNNIMHNNSIIYTDDDSRKIKGRHNLINIMFVLAVSEILRFDLNKVGKVINSFNGLPHRLENIGEYDGVTYYNDSICTIPEACIFAVETLKNVNTLIIGGMERNIDYTKLIDYLNNRDSLNLVCMPDTGYRIAEAITNDKINIVRVNNLEEAVKVSKEITAKGSICLMSPAAASYGFFKNFEERGDKFRELVRTNN